MVGSLRPILHYLGLEAKRISLACPFICEKRVALTTLERFGKGLVIHEVEENGLETT